MARWRGVNECRYQNIKRFNSSVYCMKSSPGLKAIERNWSASEHFNMRVCETVQATIAGGWNTIYKFTRDFVQDVVIVVGKYQIGKPCACLRSRLPGCPVAWLPGCPVVPRCHVTHVPVGLTRLRVLPRRPLGGVRRLCLEPAMVSLSACAAKTPCVRCPYPHPYPPLRPQATTTAAPRTCRGGSARNRARCRYSQTGLTVKRLRRSNFEALLATFSFAFGSALMLAINCAPPEV